MQMPRLAMPRVSLGSLGERATVWYALYTVLLFLLFLIVTFPHDILVRRGLTLLPADSGVSFDFDDARFAWHRGLELSNVRITAPEVAAPVLEFTRLWIRPQVGDLAQGNWKSVALEADAYGGHGFGHLTITDAVVAGVFQLDGMSLGRYSLLRAYLTEGTVGGRVNARVDFRASGRDLTAAQGSGDMTLTNASIESAKVDELSVPDLHFGETKLIVTLQGDRLDIKEFTAKGKELDLEASGQVSLRQPVEDSVLNLRAAVKPGPEPTDPIKGLLAIVQPAPGQSEIRLTGPLSSPKRR